MTAVGAAPAGRRRVVLVCSGLFAVFLALWFVSARSAPQLLERDWVAFDRAASRVVQGRFAEAYRASADEQFPFLYPPYALWITGPLALLGRIGSYLLVAATGLGAMAGARWGLGRLLPEARPAISAVLAVALVSGSFLLVVITGQNTAVYVAAILIGMERRSRAGVSGSRAAGAAWAVLLVKPNIAALFVLYLAARRERRSLEGFGAATALALASTIPMGWAAWQGFFDGLAIVGRIVSVTQNWYGQVTVLAAFRVTLDPLGAGWAARPLWLLACGPLGVYALRSWWRVRPPDALGELRLVGTVCLLAVAANPRLYFYDALLLMIPAAAWHLARGCPAQGPGTRRVVGACVVVAFAAGFAEFAALPISPVIGVAALVWAAAELRSLNRIGFGAPPAAPSVSAGAISSPR